MPQFEINKRIAKLRKRLAKEDVDAFIALKSVNVEYLSGFDHIRDDSNPHAVLVTADEIRFLTDGRYVEVAQREAALAASRGVDWRVDDPDDKLVIKDMHELWDLKQFDLIALEDTAPYRIFTSIEKSAQPVKVIPARNWVEEIRSVKDEAEIERIKAAQAITDKTFAHLCDFICPGLSEKEIAVELEFTLRRFGADGTSFDPIVAAGPNGSLVHAVPSDRPVQAGDLLTLDFGASLDGYCSDMTRTVFVGGTREADAKPTDSTSASEESRVYPSSEQRKVYETVLAAQKASLEAFAAGVSSAEVDAAGREIIKKAGYGDYFVHGTGHGLGLYIHEQPTVGPRNEDGLKAGEVVTCEPGIYIPGKLGVRIEDMVVIIEDGSFNLTKSPKELLILNEKESM